MRRCHGCGAFYDGPECPGDHSHIAETWPGTGHIGRIVSYDWPGSGTVRCMIVSDPDEDGLVGLMVLNENVRVTLDDVKEI